MSELDSIKKSPPNYFKDPWNILDIVTYVSLLLLVALHVADIVSHTTELAQWTARQVWLSVHDDSDSPLFSDNWHSVSADETV